MTLKTSTELMTEQGPFVSSARVLSLRAFASRHRHSIRRCVIASNFEKVCRSVDNGPQVHISEANRRTVRRCVQHKGDHQPPSGDTNFTEMHKSQLTQRFTHFIVSAANAYGIMTKRESGEDQRWGCSHQYCELARRKLRTVQDSSEPHVSSAMFNTSEWICTQTSSFHPVEGKHI